MAGEAARGPGGPPHFFANSDRCWSVLFLDALRIPLCHPIASSRPRLCRYYRALAGAWDRRQHGDLLADRWDPAARAGLPRAGAAVLHRRSDPEVREILPPDPGQYRDVYE